VQDATQVLSSEILGRALVEYLDGPMDERRFGEKVTRVGFQVIVRLIQEPDHDKERRRKGESC
jgi:hypothetical protein